MAHIFKCIFVTKNIKMSFKNSLKFVPKGQFDKNSAVIQVMAWCQTEKKSSPEPMMTHKHCLVTVS